MGFVRDAASYIRCMSFDALTLDGVPAETIDKLHLVVLDDGRTDKDKPVINEE